MPQQTAIHLCSFKECNKPATHRFRWEWGEEGTCCFACVTLMQQTAANLSRSIQFTTLDANAEPPLQRSERTQLIAGKMAAEQELEEVKTRGHTLYQQNVSLAQEVQQHLQRSRSLTQQVAELNQQIEDLATQVVEKDGELAKQSNELQRLRLLVPFIGEDETEQSRVDAG